ncbi:MAG: ankyrin repeat domain-containing protein [Chloroflexota bacterium]
MTKTLPQNPNLDYDRKQAKALFKAYQAGDAAASERVRVAHPRLENVPQKSIPTDEFKLSDAQLVIAREYGFSSWPKLKQHIEALQAGLNTTIQQFADAVQHENVAQVRALLKTTPALAKYINDPVMNFDAPAIVIAAGRNNRELVDTLIENGADVNAKSAWWAGAYGTLHNADPEMVAYLIGRGATVDIHAAVAQGMTDILEKLLTADPELVDAKGPDGQRPLHFARSTAMIDFLLDHGADINARCVDHCGTAAQYRVAEHPDLARHLLQRGAQPDIFMVCALGDTTLVKTLLDADAEVVNKRIGDADYPPVPPAPGGHIYTYNLGSNRSPHQIAQKFGQDAVYQLLLEHSSLTRRFVAACERADLETMQSILRDTPDIAKSLSDGDQRLLVDAAGANHAAGVKVLLEIGFDPHAANREGMTALHSAAFHGFAPLVKLLLQYDPQLDRKNNYGGTPLSTAVYGVTHSWRHDSDFPATIEALIAAGSKVEPEWIPSGNAAIDAILRRALDGQKK